MRRRRRLFRETYGAWTHPTRRLMPHGLAVWLVTLVTAYVGAGVVFAAAFATRGVSRVDVRAAGAGWGFRLLIVPGTVFLWPLLLRLWWRAAHGRS